MAYPITDFRGIGPDMAAILKSEGEAQAIQVYAEVARRRTAGPAAPDGGSPVWAA